MVDPPNALSYTGFQQASGVEYGVRREVRDSLESRTFAADL